MSIFHDQALFMKATEQQSNPNLYMDLVREEIGELEAGWEKLCRYNGPENQAEVADAIMDSIYVLAGLANSLWGADVAQRMWGEVQRSNMSKVSVIETSNGIEYAVKRRTDGKIEKPASFRAPYLFGIIANVE